MRQVLLAAFVTLAVATTAASDDRTAQQADSDIAAAKTISEITLSRSGNRNGHPRDALTLRSDGTFHYVGERNVPRLGNFSGKISEHYFGDVFLKIAESYTALRRETFSTGKPSGAVAAVKIKVVRDGKTDELTVWCPGLDRNLFAFEMSIRGVVADAKWNVAQEE